MHDRYFDHLKLNIFHVPVSKFNTKRELDRNHLRSLYGNPALMHTRVKKKKKSIPVAFEIDI